MTDLFFLGRAKAERKQIRGVAHFLAKRYRYGKDVLPKPVLNRLQEARGLCREGLRLTIAGEKRTEIMRQLDEKYGDLLRTERHHGRKENAEVAGPTFCSPLKSQPTRCDPPCSVFSINPKTILRLDR
ncbi:MAG: hypothetical protein EBT69_03750 [Verrucomicrobia bacterium]|nr:hypothetical protein [Verrucomicrobiota bacterium]